MKPVKFLLLLSIIFQFSCIENYIEPTTNQSIITPEMEGFHKTELNSISEEHLYMISYLATRAIMEDEKARNYFKEAMITSKSDNFHLSEILGTNISKMNPFEKAYYTQFKKYNYEVIDKDQYLEGDSTIIYTTAEEEVHLHVRPPTSELSPAGIDIKPTMGPTVITSTYSSFTHLIIEDNSLGFFFPNIDILGTRMSLEDHTSKIRTTWHPLNNDEGNAGMELNEDGGEPLFIDRSVVKGSKFVMVLRPVNMNDYNYGDIDFTKFLSN